ncbi:TIGR01212 family radical SAM protein [Tissierella sp. MSJ-40]|uniref:TIGR01212 family radical SAM protein n=1 Tax=Tissierella simiarum TaxID=2841534 RepID=A0ABS6E8K2_9FIRM|nr:TIGR01212 family radical SAM protein [Tissierella simiarum]MBU5438760.1 TIGR01212 family radical SAM protein [Tissierella simiarum]
MWGDKRYHTLNYELRKIFGQKVMKLSLDGGFTCPNRDGTLGTKGCIFCGEEGSGEFAGSRCLSIKEQIEEQIKLLSRKWDTNRYIAYFQNFTNTYSTCEELRNIYFEAIEESGVVGLAIATRPDCLGEDVLDLLSELNEKTFLWIELGLQTIHEKSAKFIRRGYPLSTYDEAIEKLKKRNIRVVTHLIFGLPNESHNDILKSIRYVAKTNTWGVKFHLLYIQKGTDLYEYYLNNPFSLMDKDEYISLVIDGLELLPKEMIVHRVTGDGKKELLYEPKWSLDKLKVLSGIDNELKIRGSYQGKKYMI